MSPADPERALAIAYAPRDAQAGLRALFLLDERFARIVTTTREPGIGLIRLAWWREALEKLDRDAAPAEPLLRDIQRDLVQAGIAGARLAGIEQGWAALIGDPIDADAIVLHARARGGTMFALAGALLGAEDPRLAGAGEVWAAADLAASHGDRTVREAARSFAVSRSHAIPADRWPKRVRSLGALYALACRDALRGERRQGSPGRLLRMLAMRFFGR